MESVMGGVGWWGGRRRLERDLTPGRRWERATDWCRQALVPPFPPCFTRLGPKTHFPHSALWRPFKVWFVRFRGALNGDPFSERLSLLETTRRGHYDSSERIKTPFVCLKLTHACLLCFWKAGAWETVHKYAFSSHWLPGHFVSLQTLFPFKCVFFSLVSLSPSCSPCPLLALPYANLSIGRRDGERRIVLQSTGASELRRCGIFIGGF